MSKRAPLLKVLLLLVLVIVLSLGHYSLLTPANVAVEFNGMKVITSKGAVMELIGDKLFVTFSNDGWVFLANPPEGKDQWIIVEGQDGLVFQLTAKVEPGHQCSTGVTAGKVEVRVMKY